jgi:hypothetical protein
MQSRIQKGHEFHSTKLRFHPVDIETRTKKKSGADGFANISHAKSDSEGT